MFKFGNIELLYLLGLIPLFITYFIFITYRNNKKIKKIADSRIREIIMPDVSKTKRNGRFILYILALCLLITAAADPQEGSKQEEVKRSGVDLMICLDVSNSMLAEDLSPTRLEAAKRAISRLIDNLKGDRIGLIVFGGEAYTQLPITTDYAAAKMFLNTIDTDIIPTQGTAIGKALDQAIESFPRNSKNKKAIIVLTDGENHEDDAIKSATTCNENGISVHTIGLGSLSGTPIPFYINGRKNGYRKDKEGNIVVTKLNESLLQQVAEAGKGVFVRASNTGIGLNLVFDEINKMEKTDYGSKIFTDYENRFQYFVGLALFFLILEILLSEHKSKLAKKLGLNN
jgi:Ca-activated chloride channel family protein